MMNHLDYQLRLYRNRNRISQAKLANMLGIRQATVADWESRKAFPKFDNLKKISLILNLDINNIEIPN